MCRALGSRAWSQMDGLDLSLGTDTWPRCTLPSFWDSVFYIKNAPKWGQLRSYLSQWWPHYMVQTGFTFPLLWFLMVFLLVLAAWPSDPLTCCSLLYLVSNPPPQMFKKIAFLFSTAQFGFSLLQQCTDWYSQIPRWKYEKQLIPLSENSLTTGNSWCLGERWSLKTRD